MVAIVTWLDAHVSITWVYVAIAVMQVGLAVQMVLLARWQKRLAAIDRVLLANDEQINAELHRLSAQLIASRLLYRNANLQHSLSFGFQPEHETTAPPDVPVSGPAHCEDCGVSLDRHGSECGMEVDDPRAEEYLPPAGWERPDLAPGSWADENRRAAGVDVGPPESILGPVVEEEGGRLQD